MLKTTFKLRDIEVFFVQTIFIALSFLTLNIATSQSAALVGIIFFFLLYLIVFRGFDYLDPLVAFSIPWLLILGFSLVPISGYAIDIHRNTDELILIVLFVGMLSSGSIQRTVKPLDWPRPTKYRKANSALFALDALFFGLTILNVVLAGYVPLIQGFLTGDSGYLKFGVHGLYGFYLAFANAWAILHFVLYLRTRRRGYLLRFISAVLVFILFVTRQNLLSVFIEALVVYSLIRRRLNMKAILIFLCAVMMLFSLAGSFRSGSIKQLAKIRSKYYWLPEPVIWLYSYSYFNIANLDNMMRFSKGATYNGSSLAQLIPSFLRPTYTGETYIEVSIFNVSSFLYPVYQDLGTAGAIFLTATALGVTRNKKRSMYSHASLYNVGTFATLYFCALFSFFVNFWFYLPIIFQLVFFRFFSGLADRVASQYLDRTKSVERRLTS
jgi:oligosaccharide repeat unit polymerase